MHTTKITDVTTQSSLEYGGWGTCPVRFICPEDTGFDLPTMIHRALMGYYIDREFGGGKLAKERSDSSANLQTRCIRKQADYVRKRQLF
jgi:hypothetical protein